MFGFTNNQVLGASLIALPFIALIVFGLIMVGLGPFLGILGVTALTSGCIFAGTSILSNEHKKKMSIGISDN